MIIFTKHARKKFEILKSHKFLVSREQVLKVLVEPDFVDSYSREPLFVAQRGLDKTRVLRVIYRKEGKNVIVITFYPGRKSQYEKNA